jgi:hypothetical protein
VNGIFRPGMRAYFIPLVAGILLSVSAFLPWVIVGNVALAGVPDVEALWIAGLGALAAVLAMLSLVTRKNSRHPLLLIGMVAFGIMFLSWRIMPSSMNRRVQSRAQAFAIVQNTNPYTYLGSRPLNVAPGTTLDNGLTMVSIRSLALPTIVSIGRQNTAR